MLHLKSLIVAVALAVASVIAAAPGFAQGTTIVVVDQQRVLAESLAGQDIRQKMETIQGQMQRELEPTATSLEQLGQTIETQSANMTPAQVQADTNLMAQARDYQTRLASLSQESDRRATELAITERRATIAFSEALKPVLDQIMAERGAQVMLGAGTVMIALPAVDVTDDVIQRLNASTPTITVNRERLPTQSQSATAGQ